MPSLTPKIIGGHTYYYARYCQRVDGKPEIVRQVYLGKIDDLVAAALFDIAQRLDLVPLLDSIIPAKL